MSLPFNKLNEMGAYDNCSTCKYSYDNCDHFRGIKCLNKKYNYSIKRGECKLFYNLWESR